MPFADFPRLPAALILAATAFGYAADARADGYVMGAGRWSCAQVIQAVETDNGSLTGQAAGWILGYWSQASFRREARFVDIIEQVGGNAIWEKTVAECRNAPADTMLYLVANAMISNTK